MQEEPLNEASPVVESIVNSQDEGTNESKDTTEEIISTGIYDREYYEKEAITVPRVMYLNGEGSLKAFPYTNASSIKEIKDTYVIIHSVVFNEEKKEWALVEFTDFVNFNNYGYVELTRLSERPYTPLYSNDKEAISDIVIGDITEKAIVQYGSRYDTYKSEQGWSYCFNKENGYIVTVIDPISNTIKSIFVNASGFKTKEGFQVGDNAIEVIESYKSKYEMNSDQHLFSDRPESIFDLGDGYVIEFSYEPEELGKESFITYIYLYNIYDGDW